MSVSSIGSKSAISVQALVDMSAQLDDLRRQLGTGKRADSYAGIGLDRGLTVGLRSQLSALSSFDQSILSVSTRLKIAQTTLTRLDDSTHTVKTATLSSAYVISQNGQTTDQVTARNEFDQMLALLNTRVGDQYIYSGRAADKSAVESMDHILNGNGNMAGLTQVTSERKQADLGANGLGRLVIPAAGIAPARINGNGATLQPDAPAIVASDNSITTLSATAGTLEINGTTVAIAAGATATNIRDAINANVTGVAAAINTTGQLVLTSQDAVTPVTIGPASSANTLTEIGLAVGTKAPVNLLTQVPGLNGQTLQFTVGANPTLTVTFGAGMQTMAQLNAALGTLVGGTASMDTVTGNISVAALNTTNSITVAGTAPPGTFGLGSLTAAPVAGTRVALSEDVVGSPFGFKLSTITSNLTGGNVTGPTGTPPGVFVDFNSLPTAGQKVDITFTLPDGTSEKLSLVATNETPLPDGKFAIGATPQQTATNFQAALTSAVGTLAQTSLTSASAIVAAKSFFTMDDANPPMRVNGPPFATATTLTAGTAANTVFWYTGEGSSSSARGTATARIDPKISVQFGMRANEEAFTSSLANIAAFAAMSFSASDVNGQDRYKAMTQRVSINLDGKQGAQKIADIEAEIAGTQSTMQTTSDRHTQTSGTLQDLLSTIEGAPIEEVSAQILTLQTRLQASLQTTALLAKTSLVNFL